MLSIPHLVIIFLIALIVLGPEKLPQVARVLGKAMADFRRITTDFRVQIEDEMRDMERHTRLQQMTPAEASPYHPTDPELLGAIPATSAPLTPAEVPPPPDAFTSGTTESTSPETPAPVAVTSTVEITPIENHPEKPADGQHKPA
jgi:sec-independent protein translocase protein TatB